MAYGLSNGPSSAATTSSTTSAAEATAARLPRNRRRASAHRPPSIVADAGIEPAIHEVHGEVEQQDQRGVEDDHAHDERVVAVDRALHEVTADAGQAEHLLDDQRACEQRRGRGPEEAH